MGNCSYYLKNELLLVLEYSMIIKNFVEIDVSIQSWIYQLIYNVKSYQFIAYQVHI